MQKVLELQALFALCEVKRTGQVCELVVRLLFHSTRSRQFGHRLSNLQQTKTAASWHLYIYTALSLETRGTTPAYAVAQYCWLKCHTVGCYGFACCLLFKHDFYSSCAEKQSALNQGKIVADTLPKVHSIIYISINRTKKENNQKIRCAMLQIWRRKLAG